MGRGTQLFVVGVLFLVACSSFRQLCASSSDDDDHTVNTLYYLCLSTTDYTRLEIRLDLSDSDILFLDFRYFTTHSTTRSKAVGSFLTKKNIKVFTYTFFFLIIKSNASSSLLVITITTMVEKLVKYAFFD